MSLKSLQKRYADYCHRAGLPTVSIKDLEYLLEAHLQGQTGHLVGISEDDVREHLKWVRRFRTVWRRVEGEEYVLSLLCIEAVKAGYHLDSANDGEERHDCRNKSLGQIIDILSAVDQSSITFRRKPTGRGLMFALVFGNSPEELIADHTAHPDAELIWQAVQRRYGGRYA